jgi:signal transduction histidine kinase
MYLVCLLILDDIHINNITMVLKEEEKLKSLIARVTHDILSPIHTIQGIAQLTKEEPDLLRKNEYASMLLQSTIDLTSRVQELIREYFEPDHSVRFIDLSETAQSVLNQLNPPDEVMIEVFNHCPNSYKGHYNKLFSILQNLISNAIKYRDAAKQQCFVRVQFDQTDDGIIITVSDNGLGVPTEWQQKIFKERFRIDPSIHGHGLGLYIVKSLVDELNGKIEIESTGNGTTFYIKLPKLNV